MQSAIITNGKDFSDYAQGKEVDLHVLVFPDWEKDFAEGSVIDVCLKSNGIDTPRFDGVVVKNHGKVSTIPATNEPFALKLTVKRILT